MSGGPETDRDDEDRIWADASIAHMKLAGHLLAAALSLELACRNLDDEGNWLYGELAEILPADEPGLPEVESDRAFLLDRAQSHRKVAAVCAENAAILATTLADSLREEVGVADSWDRRDELRGAIRLYASSVADAAAEAEVALLALDASVSKAEVEEPGRSMAGILRFLNSEAALFSAFTNLEIP